MCRWRSARCGGVQIEIERNVLGGIGRLHGPVGIVMFPGAVLVSSWPFTICVQP